MLRSIAGRLTLAACLLPTVPGSAHAQLFSPGRLAAAHSELEGLRGCTSCHQLGKSGVSAERCLACHEALKVRIEAGSGYHATVTPDDCATCHQDHLGEAFDLVRLDERAFDHSALGFPLELGHAELGCRDCHEPSLVRDPVVMARKGGTESLARTFLGLPTDCAGCHESESPHGAQFAARGCADCHQVTLWSEPTAFDHRSAAFRLDGRHTDLACAACHGAGAAAWYTPLPFGACSDCHADPHRGAMSGACASCHEASALAGALAEAEDPLEAALALVELLAEHGASSTAEDLAIAGWLAGGARDAADGAPAAPGAPANGE